jgi:hypothetical protein
LSLDFGYDTIRECFAVCPVHQCTFETDTVPIVYGTPIPPTDAETAATRTLFPRAYRHVGGGCVVQEQKTADVEYCPECRVVLDRWESQAFKRNITSPDSQEIRLFLAVKASHFNGESPKNRLVRYYKSWKPPRTPHDRELSGFAAVVTQLHSSLTSESVEVDARSLLRSLSPIFQHQPTCDDDSVILDHCKMHYIAADAILNG